MDVDVLGVADDKLALADVETENPSGRRTCTGWINPW